MGRSAADTVMGGDLLLEGHRLCNTLVWGQQFYTTCVALQLLPNYSSHHPNLSKHDGSCRATAAATVATLTGDPAVEFAYVNVNGGHTSHMREAPMGATGFLLLTCLHHLCPPPWHYSTPQRGLHYCLPCFPPPRHHLLPA